MDSVYSHSRGSRLLAYGIMLIQTATKRTVVFALLMLCTVGFKTGVILLQTVDVQGAVFTNCLVPVLRSNGKSDFDLGAALRLADPVEWKEFTLVPDQIAINSIGLLLTILSDSVEWIAMFSGAYLFIIPRISGVYSDIDVRKILQRPELGNRLSTHVKHLVRAHNLEDAARDYHKRNRLEGGDGVHTSSALDVLFAK
jgi:hypothetical protein